jgi:2-polyprenyl-3-methyl-5-hydroxy-6-metoxy-1,4-benzoquinol methylase
MIRELLAERGPIGRTLDFGSGDGWFASELRAAGQVGELTAIDVKRRPISIVEPMIYDGGRLPFDDRAFDLIYSVDVLHHCPEPEA